MRKSMKLLNSIKDQIQILKHHKCCIGLLFIIMKIWTWTLKLNLISSESNLSELASMMKMLYERINTADGGVTQCTAQYSNVLNCTLQSQSEKESSWTPQFSALARPSTGVSASVARCCIPVIISLVFTVHWDLATIPTSHSLSPEHLLTSDTDRAV